MSDTHYVYILLCADGTLYTGWTTDVKRRLEVHNAGKGAKYTRSRKPVTLVHLEVYQTKSEALKREAAIKKMTAAQKRILVHESGIKTVSASLKEPEDHRQ